MENLPLGQVTGDAWRVAATLAVTLTAGAVGMFGKGDAKPDAAPSK